MSGVSVSEFAPPAGGGASCISALGRPIGTVRDYGNEVNVDKRPCIMGAWKSNPGPRGYEAQRAARYQFS